MRARVPAGILLLELWRRNNVTIHQPAGFWSRLPAHFAIGAVAVVAAAIVIGAVAVRETDGSDGEPSAESSVPRRSIIVDEGLVWDAQAHLEENLDDLFEPRAGAPSTITITEDRIRAAEAALPSGPADIFTVPPERVVTLPGSVPPHVIVGPLYP